MNLQKVLFNIYQLIFVPKYSQVTLWTETIFRHGFFEILGKTTVVLYTLVVHSFDHAFSFLDGIRRSYTDILASQNMAAKFISNA